VGSSPPEGWLGKNWACTQLIQEAQGDMLFFTDADTLHQPKTLRFIVTAMIGEKADLLTGFPRQEVHTWGERLLVPFFPWAFFCFTPLWLAYRLRMPTLSCAVGQMMLFRREAYQAIGGHESVSSSIIDDLMLARRIKAAGLRWRVINITDLITCRMYHGSREAFNGFTKNLFAAFDFHLLSFLFAFLWLAMMFLEPLIVLALLVFGQAPLASAYELAVCAGLSLLLWLIPYLELGIPFYLAFLYPATILANEAVAFQSLRLSLAGRLTWKGRSLAKPHWKWF
jgi:chlorobactene glucosyltransferase